LIFISRVSRSVEGRAQLIQINEMQGRSVIMGGHDHSEIFA